MSHEAVLGNLAGLGAQRDAIHVAIAPVVADCKIEPGRRIGFVDGGGVRVGYECPDRGIVAVGIADPFLVGPVLRGQSFFMCLFPGTVTGMRHHWSHPSFADVLREPHADDGGDSRKWIENFSHRLGLSYKTVMDAAARWQRGEGYTNVGDNEQYTDHYYESAEFWRHYAAVTGSATADDEGLPFSCAC